MGQKVVYGIDYKYNIGYTMNLCILISRFHTKYSSFFCLFRSSTIYTNFYQGHDRWISNVLVILQLLIILIELSSPVASPDHSTFFYECLQEFKLIYKVTWSVSFSLSKSTLMLASCCLPFYLRASFSLNLAFFNLFSYRLVTNNQIQFFNFFKAEMKSAISYFGFRYLLSYLIDMICDQRIKSNEFQKFALMNKSKCKVCREDTVYQIEAEPNSRRNNPITRLPSERLPSLLELQIRINLHHVQPHQMPFVSYSSNNLISLNRSQSSPKFRASTICKKRIYRIDVERNVKGFVSYWIEVVDSLFNYFPDSQMSNVIHSKAFNAQPLQIDPFIRVNISNGNKHQILKGNFIDQPIKSWNTLCKPCSMCYRVSMIIRILTLIWIDEIRVCIHPYYLKILIIGIQCVKSWSAH